jgi:hypothetical protein
MVVLLVVVLVVVLVVLAVVVVLMVVVAAVAVVVLVLVAAVGRGDDAGCGCFPSMQRSLWQRSCDHPRTGFGSVSEVFRPSEQGLE